MTTFWTWLEGLIAEARRQEIDPQVLRGYDLAFKDELRKVIGRTENPDLRARLIEMLGCPIRDSRGQCRSFTDYIMSALLRNGIHHRYDIEAALGYIAEKMLMDRGDDGSPRTTVFGGFKERPGQTPDFNPLQPRFLKYLQFAINNVRKGKVPRLADTGQWPAGTVSIGQGRARKDDPVSGVSPDEIAARPSGDTDLGELVRDIEALLARKEAAYGFPLADLFRAIMAGMTVDQQRKQFGDRRVRPARQVVMDTIRDYAEKTENYHLLTLLQRLRDGQDRQQAPAQPATTTAPRPVLSDQERDYASIADVVARFDRPVGTPDLGKYRRRWLEYPPRTPGSGYRNRLEEVLGKMVQDGVLNAKRTAAGATVYEPGPGFERYRQGAGAVGG